MEPLLQERQAGAEEAGGSGGRPFGLSALLHQQAPEPALAMRNGTLQGKALHGTEESHLCLCVLAAFRCNVL